MLQDTIRWRRLVAEYSELCQLGAGMTPNARGQRFNGMIAELLTAYGLRAKSDQRSVGELDVVFSYAGRRFILEAKWERGKTGTGPIAKLQRRVEQRMAGVTGVFLAIKGFTDDAIAEVDKGRRLDVLLLDQSHWEAMLSGFVPPQELFDLATDAASFHGRAYTPITELLRHRTETPTVTPEPVATGMDGLLRVATVRAVGHTDGRRTGIGTDRDGSALITLEQGILAVDLVARRSQWVAPVFGCSNGSIATADGALLMTRGHGVGRWAGGRLTVVSSGAARLDDSHLLANPDGSTWCLDRGSADVTPACLIRLGTQVGDEKWRELPLAVTAAAWLTSTRLVVSDGTDLIQLSSQLTVERRLPTPAGSVLALTTLNEQQVVTLLDDMSLVLFDLQANEHRPLGSFSISGPPGALIRRTDESLYVMGRHRAKDGHVTVAEVEIVGQHPANGRIPRRPEPEVGGSRSRVTPVEAVRPARGRARATVEAIAVPPAARKPIEPPVAADAAGHANQSPSTDERLAEQRRGYAEGTTAAVALPLYALEGLVAANFEIANWLKPWRDHWDRIVSGQAVHGETLPDWLPSIAQLLGAHAAPPRVAHAQLTPSVPYVIGFADGLRAAWQDAVRSRLVPGDRETLSQWVRTPLSQPGLPPALHTIADLQTAAKRTRRSRTWKWIGRGLLWLLTLLFGVSEIAAIAITVTGQWEPNTAANAVIGNACFGIPFAGLLWFAVWDLRRLLNGGQPPRRSPTPPQTSHEDRPLPEAQAASTSTEPLTEPPREDVDRTLSRADRGNPPGEYAAFAASSGMYWTVVGINTLLIILLAIIIPTTDIPLVAKALIGLFAAFLVLATVGFANMARNPTKLEIGRNGIQVYSPSGPYWFPWQVLNRVEMMRLEGGTRHLVGWCTNPELFPESVSLGGGPRFLPKLKAVAICPLNVLHARRHLVARALQTYGGSCYRSPSNS
ncbi:restriction endonuclease [Micromonospora sp. STR1_7]|uniref:Restriction endonuclease n=1 Tax=Micromonospora parastrephiae TaxID=2806101 RepID=A0ABS1XT90_9ACTN|nr:restriction endonuclease [Micromonospora parastrephiae]MBM0232478.1 restriction endonuclease [Micromonospora parastrephiae]